MLLSVSAADGYIGPGWYADPASGGAVPTWNYIAVELSGNAALAEAMRQAIST